MENEPVNKELYREVARELGVPEKLVKDVVLNGQAKYTAHVMTSGSFDSIKWPYLGSFRMKHKVMNVLNYMKGLTAEQRKFFMDQQKLIKQAKKNKKKNAARK